MGRFALTLEAGQKPLAEILEKASSRKLVSGADAFLLYDTYGYPLEITQDAAADRGIKVPHFVFLPAIRLAPSLSQKNNSVCSYYSIQLCLLGAAKSSQLVSAHRLACKC